MKTPKKIAILGFGHEGQWWGRFFAKFGIEIVGSNSAKENVLLIPQAEAILMSVPMSQAVKTARQIKALAKKEAFIISVCGRMLPIKREFQNSAQEILFLHRMCGPHVGTMKGENLIVHDETLVWKEFSTEVLKATEANITFDDPRGHDSNADVVQRRLRMVAMAYAGMLKPKHRPYATVPLQAMIAVISRIAEAGPSLSSEIVSGAEEGPNSFSEDFEKRLWKMGTMSEAEWIAYFKRVEETLGIETIQKASEAVQDLKVW